MSSYILRRIIQTMIMIALVSYVCFFLMSLMPGDPIELMLSSNPKMTTADVERLRELYGLNQPATTRYINWVKTIAHGDLGYSRTYRVPVTEIIGARLLNSFILSLIALIFSLAIAIPLGVFSALRPNSKLDTFVSIFSFTGISVPSFWLGLLLILIFAVKLGWLPAGGTETIDAEFSSSWRYFWDRGLYIILPVLSLSLQQIGRFVRFVRSSMRETLQTDFVRTAKAKGLSMHDVIWKHAFRNALIPVITIIALSISTIFSGALLTETVFAYQGVGKLIYDSIMANDYNVAMVSFIISVSMVLIMSLVADLLYGVIDPRISYS